MFKKGINPHRAEPQPGDSATVTVCLLCLDTCLPGVLVAGGFGNFCTEATGFSQQFPGLRSHLLMLPFWFRVPFFRDYIMCGGRDPPVLLCLSPHYLSDCHLCMCQVWCRVPSPACPTSSAALKEEMWLSLQWVELRRLSMLDQER